MIPPEATGIIRIGELDYCYDESGRLYKRRGKGFIKTYPDKDGYLKYHLGQPRGTYNLFVHQVVWKIFHGRVPEGMTIDLIDEDKQNNHPDNLQLMSAVENAVKGNAKVWFMKDPNGISHEIYNMEAFCREHHLHAAHMRSVHNGYGYIKSYKGWTKA